MNKLKEIEVNVSSLIVYTIEVGNNAYIKTYMMNQSHDLYRLSESIKTLGKEKTYETS